MLQIQRIITRSPVTVVHIQQPVRLEHSSLSRLLSPHQVHITRLGPDVPRGRRSLGKQHRAEEKEERTVQWRKDDRQSREVEVRGDRTSVEVPDLRLFSRYELSVTVYNSKGEGPHSAPHGFRTPEGGRSVCLKTEAKQQNILFYANSVCVCVCSSW